jgi:phosphatidylglycerophosphate synthase
MPTLDRRPITFRETRFARTAARVIARTGISPNQISVLSIVCSGAAGIGLLEAAHGWRGGFVLAAVGIQLRLQCNLFDGMVAVEHGKKSATGGIFNELPDRLSDILILMGAAYAINCPQLGLWAALLAVMTAYIRTLATHVGAEPDFIGPMAKQQRAALITVASIVCFALPAIYVLVFKIALWAVTVGSGITCARRFSRALASLESRPA